LEDWTNNSWSESGGVRVKYQEVNTLDLYTLNTFATKIYPNPSEGIISIEYDKNLKSPLLEIYDTKGSVLKIEDINQNKIDISELNRGIYLYILTDGNNISKGKLVIK
jgi:hypothetical protein